MPAPTFSISRIVATAVIAGFFALMLAGPGSLIVPATLKLTSPLVCPAGSGIGYKRVRYAYQRPGESSLEVNCVRDDGTRASDDIFGKAFLALSGIYFLILFITLLLLSLFRTPKEPAPAGGPPPSLSGSALDDVSMLARAGRKIEAIKRVRELTGCGLKEAKDYVESLDRFGSAPARESSIHTADDPAEKLIKLKEMLDAGLITPEDYEAKKAEILSRV